ncbi:MAG: hypothetical protein IKD71_00830 [Solobacterium sp.]|nr:hypothetical protein [Solobacterium sp.]
MKYGVMFCAYPDSIGHALKESVHLLQNDLKDCFSSFYLLPSIYHWDLDRGFGVVDYGINERVASREDLAQLQKAGITLMLDLVMNHVSSSSPMFRDVLKHGTSSRYYPCFINWNDFWKDKGTVNGEGIVVPDEQYTKDMYFRKPGLPVLCVTLPDGTMVPFWNTFYQDAHNGKLTAQVDLDIKSPLVWEYYEETLRTLSSYGAGILRLDAFAYASKIPGKRNFCNEPETSEILSRLQNMAETYQIKVLPEIHGTYAEHLGSDLSDADYLSYDFFLPGLILHAIESGNPAYLVRHAEELYRQKTPSVHMLGCHDGIPVLDLQGLLPETEIRELIGILVERGGLIKNLHGAKNMYYQVNTTYYSALGCDDSKMSLARAIQLFMPGIPLVWYLDLFEGENDYGAVNRGGAGSHKEINRTDLSVDDVRSALRKASVQEQISLIRLRNTFPAFGDHAVFTCSAQGRSAVFRWECSGYAAVLTIDLGTRSYTVETEIPA